MHTKRPDACSDEENADAEEDVHIGGCEFECKQRECDDADCGARIGKKGAFVREYGAVLRQRITLVSGCGHKVAM